jgi:hypothetical protein
MSNYKIAPLDTVGRRIYQKQSLSEQYRELRFRQWQIHLETLKYLREQFIGQHRTPDLYP